MRHSIWRPWLLFGALSLAACSGEQNSEANEEQAQTGGVIREETPPPRETIIAPVQPVLQTQPGPKGTQVALNSVKVTGDIMTVSLTYSGGSCCIYTPLEEVSAIDDATSQRISVLKDNSGRWMAAPVHDGNKDVRIDSSQPAQVWFKFPAPPPTSMTVSIAVPGVGPFDGVPVAR